MTTTACRHCGFTDHDEPEGQLELFEPEHVSSQQDRRRGAERIFADLWERGNVRSPGINTGYVILEHILCPSGQRQPDRVSQREATVAACVIQWLGTNCGNSFLRGAERKIEEEQAIMHKFRRPAVLPDVSKERHQDHVQMARIIADKFGVSASARYGLYCEILAIVAGAERDMIQGFNIPIISMSMEADHE